MDLIKELHQKRAKLDKINYDKIALIAKKEGAKGIEDYRPIALHNSAIKIVAKVLANRITATL